MYVGQAEAIDENEIKAYVDALAAVRYRILKPYLLFLWCDHYRLSQYCEGSSDQNRAIGLLGTEMSRRYSGYDESEYISLYHVYHTATGS